MEKQNRTLTITLKSDLCIGSGYSYGGIINNDTCYDNLGLPYIPARRLKGCLREAAEFIGISEEEICKIFGKGGSERIQGVIIENAYLEHYDELYQELKKIPAELKEYVTPQSILEQFTNVRTQTKIGENGVAKDGSLRSFRSITHYSSMEPGQEMKFLAKIQFVKMDDKDIELFEQTVKALRNMGLNRNRGLGSVKCTLDQKKETENTVSGKNKDKMLKDVEQNKIEEVEIYGLDEIKEEEAIYQLSYVIRNKAPLVFNIEHNYSTEKYISGQNILGYFAAAYLREGQEAEEEFEELFLKNQVIFSNLYPCDEPEAMGEIPCDSFSNFCSCNESKIQEETETSCQKKEAYKIYYPAPLYINKLKKTEKYVNITKFIPKNETKCKEDKMESEFDSEHGNYPRRLQNKFIWTDGKNICLKEVETDIVYHHTKKSDKQNSSDGDLLYSFEAICPQQYFAGTITGKGKHIRKLAEILKDNSIQLGKSKSSQYGNCTLAGMPKVQKLEEVKKKYARGSKILVTLQSDGIFLNEAGYTLNCNEVREAVRQALNIEEAKNNESNRLYSELQVRKLIGFYGKWNLKRQAIPVVSAGSTFEFLLGKDVEISQQQLYVGERIGEGYGKIGIMENDKKDCRLIEFQENCHEKENEEDCGLIDIQKNCHGKEKKENTCQPESLKFSREICKSILLKEMKMHLLNDALPKNVIMKNSTMVGKITLMLMESIQDKSGNRQEAYRDFCKKIEEIKEKKKREQITELKNQMICEGSELQVDKLRYLEHLQELVKIYHQFIDGGSSSLLKQNSEKHGDEITEEGSSSLLKQNSEKHLEELLGSELKQELKNLWSDYFLGVLTLAKYENKKQEEKKGEEGKD